MAARLAIWSAVTALLVGLGSTQSIKPMNWTRDDTNPNANQDVGLSLSVGQKMMPLAAIMALTTKGGDGIPVFQSPPSH